MQSDTPTLLRFVLLEHDTCPQPGGTPVPHWDFLIERSTTDELATWRLDDNPIVTLTPVHATRLPDHRRIYLEYEGELTRGRGRVRRVDRGTVRAYEITADAHEMTLAGERLIGRFRIAPTAGESGTLEFTRQS